jgi:hypothetical protein
MKIVKINSEDIAFDNGFEIMGYHEQDCCESVYADFSILKDYNLSTVTGKTIDIKDIEFVEDIEKYIEKVEDAGFNIISKIGEKFFVPCYNSQNGYYSSDLSLIIRKNNNAKVEINISDCVKDDIF